MDDKSIIVNEQAIKEQADILQIIGEFVRLKKKGRFHVGSCPLHGENTPSFTVTPSKGIFKCFGCGKGGDVVTFLQEHEKITYRESLLWLADYYRISPEFNEPTTYTFTRRITKNLPPPAPIKPPSFIDKSDFNKSLSCIDSNNLIKWLVQLFGADAVDKLRQDYPIGTSRHWSNSGATVFFQIDEQGEVRGGKVMLYNPETGKRRREEIYNPTWVHAIKKDWSYNLVQTFYGAHLISKYPQKTIGIVESEKTALLCAHYFPDYVFLATGALNNGVLKNNITLLADRRIVLFGDLSPIEQDENKIQNILRDNPGYEYDKAKGIAYNIWGAMVSNFQDIGDFTVSDYLEINATEQERAAKMDIGDYIVKIHTENPLKEQFKNEFLCDTPPPQHLHLSIWLKYEAMGLTPQDAQQVINELMADHNYSPGEYQVTQDLKMAA